MNEPTPTPSSGPTNEKVGAIDLIDSLDAKDPHFDPKKMHSVAIISSVLSDIKLGLSSEAKVEIRQVDKPAGDQVMQLELEGGHVVHLGVRRS